MNATSKQDKANDKNLGAAAEEQIKGRGEKLVELKDINKIAIRA